MEKIRAKHIIAMLLILAAMAALCACNAQQADVPLASEAEREAEELASQW